jgi:hypothetical protein
VVDPHDEKHHLGGEEEGGISSESAERQTRTFRHAEDMNDVILTTVKAGAPGLDVPGQGRARRYVGEMTIAEAPGVHRNTLDLRNRHAVAAETHRGQGLRITDGNGGDTRQTERAVEDTDRLRPRLYRHRLVPIRLDPRTDRLRDHQLDLHPGRETTLGGNVRYL